MFDDEEELQQEAKQIAKRTMMSDDMEGYIEDLELTSIYYCLFYLCFRYSLEQDNVWTRILR
jgi:hypothetical protein